MERLLFVAMTLAIASLIGIVPVRAQNITTHSEHEFAKSTEKNSLCKEIVGAPSDASVDDFGKVTYNDGTRSTCAYVIEQQAIGGILKWDKSTGSFEEDKQLTERAKRFIAQQEKELEKLRAGNEIGPLSDLDKFNKTGAPMTKISDEEKSLCSDIMPGHDREIEDSGTVTLEDGSTQTCDYLIEQQAIGAIFPNTGAGAGEPDKELTERAIKMRAALGLNASGLPALTYDELIRTFREAMGK